ncbi:Rib/alpha-like domain-containing protein [Streptococcus azizii]|uniref:Rib/alpha-like domain-containing protein n=1 Tax=Streptococcus azizii TaxID=1579424 RepID=UPI00097C61BB|nr:Rib/alpha-like domain-containing protein [Streptococcus azizii]ONK27532.1 hypothetical protein BVE85_06315 [Streptococcus azizii]
MKYSDRGKRKPLLKDEKVELRYGLKKIGTRLVSCIIGATIIFGSIINAQAESRVEPEHATLTRSSESASPISEWKPDNFEDGSDAVVISESGYSQIGPLGWRAAIADPFYTEGTASKFGWSAKPGGNANYADELIRIKGTLNEDKTSIHWKVIIKGTNSGEYKGVMRDFYRPYYLIGTSRGLGKPENWRVSNSTTTLTTYPSDFDSMETRSRKIYAGTPKEVRFPDGTTREFTIFGEKGYPTTEWAGGYRLGVTGPDREASSRYNIEKYIYYSKYFLEDFMQSATIQDATRIYEFDTRILPNEVTYLGAGTPNVASQFGNYMKWGQDFRQDVDFTDKVWITVGATSREATGTAATKPNGTGIYNFSKIAIIDTSYTDADKNDPQGRPQTVTVGEAPTPANSLDSVPSGSQVSYKTPVDTSTIGDKPAVVVVTYPDGSTDEIPVTVTVVDPRNDADRNDPQGRPQTVTVGEAPTPANSLDSVPVGSQVSYKTPVDTSTVGDKPAIVVVTYPDGSTDEISVTVTVVDPRNDADKNDPQGQNQEVNLGDTPDVARSLVQVPAGSQVSYKTPVDTSTVGDKPAIVVVTYPDGSTDELPVTVTVVDPRSDADKNDPQGQNQEVNLGDTPEATNSLVQIPAGSQVSYKTPVDTSTAGDKPAVVVVTYPDGSSDEIPVTVTVVDPRSDADKNDPQGRPQTVTVDEVPTPANSLDSVPAGSQVSYKTPVDTSTVGDKPAVVVVTYLDGSSDELPVTVTVVDPRSDADKNDPQGRPQTVTVGEAPIPANSLDSVPAGSQVSYKIPVDTSAVGDKPAIVVVTYPDGSTDELPVTVTVVDPRSDADRNDPQGRPQTVTVGEVPTPANSLDSVPSGSQVSYKTPVDTSTAGDKPAVVVVTYPDGSIDEIPVTVTVVDPRSDADRNNPQGQNQEVNLGDTPDAARSLVQVPAGSQVSYKTPVDTSTVGDKSTVVVVTYPDGSTDEISVTVTVVDPRSDADKNNPKGQNQEVNLGDTPEATNSLVQVPTGSQVSYKTPVDTSAVGDKPAVVIVTYPDGSTDEIPVTVTVVAPRSEADRNNPQGQNQEVNIGDTPDAARSLVQVPSGSQVSYKTPVDTSTAGTKDTIVVVTYPDGSTDEIPVTVTVVDPRSDADKNNPQGQNQEVNLGDTPDVARSLVQVPAGSQVSYKTPVDSSTVGDKPAVVVVTYPDGSSDELPVTVTVVDPRSDADKNDPQGQNQEVNLGDTPEATNSLVQVPAGSQVSYKTPVDTSTAGTKDTIVVVTYPDGSTDEIPVTVTVVDPRSDADRNEPQGRPQTVTVGEAPIPANSLDSVPSGSQVSYKTPVDTSTVGDKPTVVVVTYPDGSTDEIPVTVTVVDPRSDADKNDPQGRPQTVTVGEAPIPANSLDSVPSGSQVSYKTPVDTSTVGDKPAVVVVTYPDGSTDEIPVTVTVVDPRNDADRNNPQGQNQEVNLGDTPDAARSLVQVPAGSQVSYKTPVDTSTAGTKDTVVVVTYPDGSSDEIPVTVTVVDPRSDADKNDPQGRPQTVTVGEVPTPANSLDSVPSGSQVSYKIPVDTSTVGDKPAVVVVTYPDGSTDEIPVTVTVVDTRSDADKNNPQGQNQEVNLGDTPDAARSLVQVPSGSQVSYKTPVDTSTVGTKDTIVVVTYPDGSTDEIPVTVTVVDPRSDADKNDPQGQNQEVNLGDTPDVARSLVQVPSGSQVSYKTPVDTSTVGDKSAIVVVTYPDGSTDEISVTVTVVDPRSDADKNNSRNQSKVDGSGASNSLNQMIGRVRKLPQTGTRLSLLGVVGILLAGIGVFFALVKKARDTIQKRSKG